MSSKRAAASTIGWRKQVTLYAPQYGDMLSALARQDYVRRLQRQEDATTDPDVKAALTRLVNVFAAAK